MNFDPRINWQESTHLFDRLHWNWTHDESSAETTQSKIAIVGLPDAGKKTLLNSLLGWEAVTDSPDTIRNFGLFSLIDLPANTYDAANVLHRLEQVDLILYLLDGRQGVSQDDFAWVSRLRDLGGTLVVIVNRLNLLEAAAARQLLATIKERLTCPIIPVAAADESSIQEHFIPALLRLCPEASSGLANQIAGLRRRVVYQTIMRSAFSSVAVCLDNPSLADTSVLLNVQLQLIKRIAAIYGYKDRGFHRYEMIVSAGLRFYLKWVTKLAARFPQIRAWVVYGAMAASSTLVIGWLAAAYYGLGFSERIAGWMFPWNKGHAAE